MEWSWPESVSSNRQRVMEELVQGREMANQLPGILREGDVISAEGLVTKILELLTDTLLIMNVSSQECSNDKEKLIHASSASVVTDGDGGGGGDGSDSSSWDVIDPAVKSEDWSELNEESCKSTKMFKDRRGSYKRRKTSHSWTKDTLDLVDDGHAWRKYGQKTILNTKYPRNYFRCTHKFDQNCKATKHTQKIKDEPQLFRTTYFGNHTCIDHLKAPEFILDCASNLEDPSQKNMIHFGNSNHNTTLNYKQERQFFSTFPSIKKESNKENEMMMKPIKGEDQATTHHERSSASSPYRVPPAAFGVFESSGGLFNGFSTTSTNDHDDLISSMMDHYFFDNDFPFEF